MRLWVQARVGEEALKLMYNGERYSIDKTVRANLLTLDADQVPHDVADVIQCADDIWASSVAKFKRLSDLADTEDKRVRGAFVFNGGAATGRASSYGAQVHNFTRKCVKDPQATRDAMVRGHSVVPKFGVRVTDVLKGMLRPSLIPAPGNVLIVADWAGIEARCNPWLSGDAEDVLQVFRDGSDIYVREAQGIFRVADISPEQRQVGKVAILACFTAKTKVLTYNGVKDIVEVLLTDKLWDGISWVSHQGLVSRGEREVINVCGMEVTPDHLIKINQTWIQAQELASSKSTLRLALATGSASLPFLGLKGLNTELVLSTWLEFNARVAQHRILLWTTIYVKENLLAVILALKSSLVIIVRTISNTLMPAPMMHTVDVCLTGYPPAKIDVITRKTAGMPIMAGGAYTYTSLGELIKQLFFDISSHLTDGINRIWSLIEQTLTKATSRITYASSLEKKISLIKDQSKICSKKSSSLKPVYDILNSGENHQFTVITDAGALLVHNCGYGGGVGAFAAMSKAYGVSLTESEAKRTVDAWRRANQWAVTYWQQLEIAYMKAMRHKGREFSAGRVTYMFDGIHLWYILPSSRVLCYPFARLEAIPSKQKSYASSLVKGDRSEFDTGVGMMLDAARSGESPYKAYSQKAEFGVTYLKAAWKPTADAKEWPRARLWKGLACENITQAVANDLLRHSLRQIDAVLHIHDEIVVECAEKNADAVAAQLEHIMCTPPAWATGLPLSVEVKIMKRYGK
jgi:DNA polymerase